MANSSSQFAREKQRRDTGQSRIGSLSDLPLAFAVVTLIGLLVFRVPPAAMDYFLAANISLSLAILLVVLYLRDLLQLPSLPTLLLLATLFRLALNVATTRLILLEANAGSIIDTFGSFVVGGNFVVGAVVFLVLVIVQFVVIAKGSERVAEVAARFTLDGMQGKQMAIDNELSRQHIDKDEASRRRANLERESRLFGSMDGAMKFVKGDAIAGIIISLVNIVGGLIIGVTQLDMQVGEAAERYSLLTIGDGLVSQIPALLISVAAGIAVTRVSSAAEGEDTNLARELLQQIQENRRSLAMAGVVLLAAGVLSPVYDVGFAPLPFLALGTLFCFPALAAVRAAQTEDQQKAKAAKRAAEDPAGQSAEAAPTGELAKLQEGWFEPQALVLRATAATLARLDTKKLVTLLRKVRNNWSVRLGFPLPEGVLNQSSMPVKGEGLDYACSLHGREIHRGSLPQAGEVAVMTQAALLAARGVKGRTLATPGDALRLIAIAESDYERLAAGGVLGDAPPTRLDAAEVLAAVVEEQYRSRADALLGMQQVVAITTELERMIPALFKAVVPKQFTLPEVAQVLRRLLQEGVPILRISTIFEVLARTSSRFDARKLAGEVRIELREHILSMHADLDYVITAFTVSDDIEQLARTGTLRAEVRKNLQLEFVQKRMQHLKSTSPVAPSRIAVFTESADARPVIWDALNIGSGIRFPVFCRAELPPVYQLKSLGLLGHGPLQA